MARRRYYKKSYRRSYSSRKFYSKKGGLSIGMEFIAGLVGAFVMPASPQIDMAGVAVATAPVRGIGKIKAMAQGYVFGQSMQHYVLPAFGVNIPDVANLLTMLPGKTGSTTSGNVV